VRHRIAAAIEGRMKCYRSGRVSESVTSAPIPKFASYCGESDCELRNQRSTGNSMILVRL
jgi:hypothetical protein